MHKNNNNNIFFKRTTLKIDNKLIGSGGGKKLTHTPHNLYHNKLTIL